MCQSPQTTINKAFPYAQYYIGEKDNENRRSGNGANHWTGPESLECYTGQFLRDTMHGAGDYKWRYRGPDGIFATYEGNVYANHFHGYGAMSYFDGRVFTGLFHKNMRWGPGIVSHICLEEDVGLWCETQLIRLTWQPEAPSVALNMISTSNGRSVVNTHRIMFSPSLKTIGETNSALELLKQNGAEPVLAVENWMKLYPKYCTDLESQLCPLEVFDRSYYKENMTILEEYSLSETETVSDGLKKKTKNSKDMRIYYAWNNNKKMIHIMKHSYKHEHQRNEFRIDLMKILSGPRKHFKPAGKHELDCRTLLMASYLGHIINVAQLINDCNVNPNVADCQGNTAIMYAISGDQHDVLQFLVEADADVNSFNDSCCTALGLALIKYLCIEKNVPLNCMVQAVLPPPVETSSPPRENRVNIIDWNMRRDFPLTNQTSSIPRTSSKIPKGTNMKIVSSSISGKEMVSPNIKSGLQSIGVYDNKSLETFREEQRSYHTINNEYLVRVNDLFQTTQPSTFPLNHYLFKVDDMCKEIDSNEADQPKRPARTPKRIASKVLRSTMKPSKNLMWQGNDREEGEKMDGREDGVSMDTAEKIKIDSLSRMMLIIIKLLSAGADPRLVRCPQPALFIATMSGCSKLVTQMARHGADVNETYTQTFNYTALDVAISLPFTCENVEVIKALLECGAKVNHRLYYGNSEFKFVGSLTSSETPGPTLLHAVLAKKVANETEEYLRREILHLLLEYKCDATLQFNGRSAIDFAMNKNMEIFDIFIKCPNIDLNTIINNNNQTILVKMFTELSSTTSTSTERLQILSNLMLFGADPLLKCQNEDETYENLFVLIRKTHKAKNSSQQRSSVTEGILDSKMKKAKKLKNEEKLLRKSAGKKGSEEAGIYKQAIDLVTECARLLHIRWIQSKLIKELIEIINKFKHRHWNMILKEYKKKKYTGLWVTAIRCLEIWDILKTVRNKLYNDNILKHLLYIVHFCNTRMSLNPKGPRYMTAQDKDLIESEVNSMLQEYKIATALTSEMVPLKRPYVTPELEAKADDKFNVCFECALPFEDEKILCVSCKLVSFCSDKCLKTNVERMNCHPCNDFIKDVYFPSSNDAKV